MVKKYVEELNKGIEAAFKNVALYRAIEKSLREDMLFEAELIGVSGSLSFKKVTIQILEYVIDPDQTKIRLFTEDQCLDFKISKYPPDFIVIMADYLLGELKYRIEPIKEVKKPNE